MHPLVATKLETIRALCLKHRVLTLDLFGSAVDADAFDADKSDVDFLVVFKPLRPGEHAKTYFGLLNDLSALLGRSVDLVSAQPIRNPYVRANIEATRVPLYAAA